MSNQLYHAASTHSPVSSRRVTKLSYIPTRSIVRLLLTTLGVMCIVLGVVGIYLPGIPTTGPLILASYLLSKGNPRLKAWMLTHPMFARYRGYLDGSQPISNRIRAYATLCMWSSIALSCTIIVLASSANNFYGPGFCILGGIIGTVFIAYWRRQPKS